MTPEFMAEFFQHYQPAPPVGQVKSKRDHESRRHQFSSNRANTELRQTGT